MMPHTNNILGTCLAVLLCICFTHEESFLTWNITDTNVGSTEIYFTLDTFTKFYKCLCNQFSRQCFVYIDVGNSVKGDIQSVAAQSKFQSNRYECLPEIQIATSSRPLICTKVIPVDNNKYSLPQYCTRYLVNENLLNITCDLASVEISSTSNMLISPTLNGDGVNINYSVECSVNTPPPTKYGTSTIGLEQTPTFENLSLSNTSLTTSSPSSSSSSSGLTKEHIIIMCLAVGIVIIISALVILGIILWRRRQNSRNNILSKVPTIHKSQCESDNGVVNHGGDFSLEDENIDPYTSKSPKASEFEASNLTGPYTTIDADIANVKFTKAAVKSKNESSIKLDESAKHHVPLKSENQYAEPEVIADADPIGYSDKTVEKITNLSKKSKNVNNHKPAADTNTKGAPYASRDLHSKPKTDNVTETYAVVKPSTKLNRGRSTNAASSPNKMENEDLDALTDDVKVLYHAPSSKYGNSNLNVHSSPDSGCVPTQGVDKGMPGNSKLYYASTDIVNSDFNSDQAKPQDTHEYFILERNYESSDCSESEDV